METLLKLSPAQSLLLRTAARRPDGRVIPPDTLRGGARVKVLTALLQRGWIEPTDDGHLMTDAGYAAIGQQRPMPPDDVDRPAFRRHPGAIIHGNHRGVYGQQQAVHGRVPQ